MCRVPWWGSGGSKLFQWVAGSRHQRGVRRVPEAIALPLGACGRPPGLDSRAIRLERGLFHSWLRSLDFTLKVWGGGGVIKSD